MNDSLLNRLSKIKIVVSDVDGILTGLDWLGIKWDENIYIQSKKINRVKAYFSLLKSKEIIVDQT